MRALGFPLDARLQDLVARLTDFFEARGVEVYATGGFVRDVLIERPVNDLDLAVSAGPGDLGPALASEFGGTSFPLDEERDIVRVILRDEDARLPEGPVHIDLQRLRGTPEEDMLTRDFTVDAMAAPLRECAAGRINLVDPTAGLADLRSGTIRAVSEANLLDDPLRILRAVRLATVLSFGIDPGTADLLRRHATLVNEAAAERRRDELLLMLISPQATTGLRLMEDLGLLSRILPELDVTRGVDQPKEHYWDVFNHSLQAVAALEMLLGPSEPPAPRDAWLWKELWSQLAWWEDARGYFTPERVAVLKLACLLHDIGKPETKSFEESGRMRFFGHAEAGAAIARALLRRLRFPSRDVAQVSAMVHAHMRPLQMAQQGAPTNRAIYRFFRDTGGAGVDALFLSLADHLAAVGPRVSREGWRRHVAVVNHVLRRRFENVEIVAPPRLVRGDDLMAELDLPAGPELGRLLEKIREAQAAGEIKTREEALRLGRDCVERSGASSDRSHLR